MSDHDDDDKSPLERTLDVFVYLPVGFVLDFPRSIPRYIARGRRQLDPARLLARPGQLGRLQDQTRSALRGLGVGGAPQPNGSSSERNFRPAPERLEADDPTATEVVDVGAADLPAISVVPALDFDATDLAITDYDSLSASQVVPRLDSLAAEELETIRVYEAATRGRKTILSKIALLQSS